jgi:hypothetical protein
MIWAIGFLTHGQITCFSKPLASLTLQKNLKIMVFESGRAQTIVVWITAIIELQFLPAKTTHA